MRKVEVDHDLLGLIEVEDCGNGLGVFCVKRGSLYWAIHLASGKTAAVLFGLKKGQVIEVVRDWLGPLTDWTQPEEELLKGPSLVGQTLAKAVRTAVFAVEEFPDLLLKPRK